MVLIYYFLRKIHLKTVIFTAFSPPHPFSSFSFLLLSHDLFFLQACGMWWDKDIMGETEVCVVSVIKRWPEGSKTQRRKRHKGQSPGGFQTQNFPCPLLCSQVTFHSFLNVWQCIWSTASQGSSPNFWHPKFLLGLHHVGVIDWLFTWVISVSRLADPKPPP